MDRQSDCQIAMHRIAPAVTNKDLATLARMIRERRNRILVWSLSMSASIRFTARSNRSCLCPHAWIGCHKSTFSINLKLHLQYWMDKVMHQQPLRRRQKNEATCWLINISVIQPFLAPSTIEFTYILARDTFCTILKLHLRYWRYNVKYHNLCVGAKNWSYLWTN